MELFAQRKICENCGSSLDLEMPSGFCPGCLLNTVLETPSDIAPGSRIEDYELLNEVARGGMGIVYRAHQRAPSRIVALKMILPSHLGSLGAVSRFRAEAEAAASLDHESILPIYAVGEHDGAPFYSMKFAEGGTLSARIDSYRDKPRDAAALMAKLVRAVAFAHEHGILHRDLKPGNILFDSAGKPFVSDFGLAKWLQRECDLTQTLAILGTPYYMAPEQATDSRSVTAAADIYSLGAILYHMLTGRPPFAGETPMEVLHRAAEEAPKRPRLTNRRVPRDLETICLKCLEKEPEFRYGSAAPLADDLERWLKKEPIRARPQGPFTRAKKWVGRNPTRALLAVSLVALAAALGKTVWKNQSSALQPPAHAVAEKSIAVLPFANLSREPDNVYFADGIGAQIAARLARLPKLEVISGSSVRRYDYNAQNVVRIAGELNVTVVLRGTVDKSGDRFRIAAHLIDGTNNAELWAQSYDCGFPDVIAAQSTIAREVTRAIGMQLTQSDERTLAASATTNSRAYEAYLKGRYVWLQRTYDAFHQAKEYFEQAIALDPNYALAYAGLADAYQFLASNDVHDRKENYERAKNACRRALELDPNLSEVHASLGLIAMNYDWDWGLAEQEFRRALALDQNNALMHDWYAEYLMAVGRVDLSLGQIDHARQLDPFSAVINTDAGKMLYYARRYDEAKSQLEATIRMYPDFAPAHYRLGHLYAVQRRCDEAIHEFKKYWEASGGFGGDGRALGEMAYAYGLVGRKIEAEAMVAALRKRLMPGSQMDDLGFAYAYLGLGEKDQAIAYLEQEYGIHGTGMTSLKSNPWYDSLRSDSRFLDLMRRVHLSPK